MNIVFRPKLHCMNIWFICKMNDFHTFTISLVKMTIIPSFIFSKYHKIANCLATKYLKAILKFLECFNVWHGKISRNKIFEIVAQTHYLFFTFSIFYKFLYSQRILRNGFVPLYNIVIDPLRPTFFKKPSMHRQYRIKVREDTDWNFSKTDLWLNPDS